MISGLASRAKQLLPRSLRLRIKTLVLPRNMYGYECDLGMYVLAKAKEFSSGLGGKPEALDAKRVQDAVFRQKHVQYMNEVVGHLETVFMPHYEENLFEYYREQQYLILLTFLSYPFRGPGSLFAHVQPFLDASSKLHTVKAIDYGAGLPFGLIHLMRTCPEKVDSVTIVDQDLIHTKLAEYILSDLCTNVDLAVSRVKGAADVAELGNRTFNLIYGKDVFEHLPQPELVLRDLLDRAETPCICCFDFVDRHDRVLQHVTQRLSHLSKVLSDYSFRPAGHVGALSVFSRM